MTSLRIVNLVAWSAMMAFMARGAWACATGRDEHYGDAMRLACFSTGAVMVGFTARWFLAPDSEPIWQLLYVLSAVVGAYIVVLGRRYGRGPRV